MTAALKTSIAVRHRVFPALDALCRWRAVLALMK